MLTASQLSDAFKSIGSDTKIFNIEAIIKKPSAPELEDFDAVGIEYPVYAFNSPKMVLDFVKKLPRDRESPLLY